MAYFRNANRRGYTRGKSDFEYTDFLSEMVSEPLTWSDFIDGGIAKYQTQMVRERRDDPFNHCLQCPVAGWIVDERGGFGYRAIKT